MASLWLFHRRLFYYGWPIIDAKTYMETIQEAKKDTFREEGIKEVYFITPSLIDSLLEKFKSTTNYGQKLEEILIQQKIEPEIINNRSGQPAFKVYKF
jgi:hypothetical protein